MKRDQEKILKRQRKPSLNIYDNENVSHKIRRPDTLDIVGSGDGEVKIKTNFFFDNKEDKSPMKGDNERFVNI